MLRSRSAAGLLLAHLLLHASELLAQTTSDSTAAARARFQAGLAAAQEGDLVAALDAFESAYAIRPHYSVLYNIGRARAGLGKHQQAVLAFERYLEEGGARLEAARRDEVQALLRHSRAQLGALKLIVPRPDSTRAWLDGRELSRSDMLNGLLELSVGTHHLLYSINGIGPVAQTLDIRPSSTTEAIVNVAVGSTALRIECPVPAVEVFVDGSLIGRTPLASPPSLDVGRHELRFVRAGYAVTQRLLTLDQPGSAVTVDCEQHPLSPLPGEMAASLLLRLQPRDARTLVDGTPFRGQPLPSGAHVLTIARDGYLPLTKNVTLATGRTTEYTAVLQPNRTTIDRERAAVRRRHHAAYILAGAGATLIAASVGVYIWNGQRYDDWRSSEERSLSRALSIQRFDDLALGLLFGGSGLVAGGALLYVSVPSAIR